MEARGTWVLSVITRVGGTVIMQSEVYCMHSQLMLSAVNAVKLAQTIAFKIHSGMNGEGLAVILCQANMGLSDKG